MKKFAYFSLLSLCLAFLWVPVKVFAANMLIMDKSVAKPSQLINYIKKVNPQTKLDCSVEELVALYYLEAEKEGIRADMAVVQAIHETGTFKFGGDAKHHQNNFCGLGVVGSGARGAHFKTPDDGVRAHIQHLMAYVTEGKPKTAIIDPRYSGALSVRRSRGFIKYWNQLAGTWAMDKKYFVKLENIYKRVIKEKADKKLDEKITKQGKDLTKGETKRLKQKEELAKKEATKTKVDQPKEEKLWKKYLPKKETKASQAASNSKKPVISNEPLKR